MDRTVFVTKLNPRARRLVYSTYLGGGSGDVGYGIAVDSAGNAYVTGDTGFDKLPDRPPGVPDDLGGGEDAFVAKLNRRARPWSTPPTSAVADRILGEGIAVDSVGNAYVTG